MTYGHLWADCLYNGISSGHNARCQVWEAFTFTFLLQVMLVDQRLLQLPAKNFYRCPSKDTQQSDSTEELVLTEVQGVAEPFLEAADLGRHLTCQTYCRLHQRPPSPSQPTNHNMHHLSCTDKTRDQSEITQTVHTLLHPEENKSIIDVMTLPPVLPPLGHFYVLPNVQQTAVRDGKN